MRKTFVTSLFIVIFIPCLAQEDFKAFIQTLNRVPVAKRSDVAKQYLAKVGSTPFIEGKENVHFLWFGKADTVKVEGELQRAWAIPQTMIRIECGEEDFFYYSYTLPSNAFLEYRFLVDKIQTIDLKNPRISQGFDFSDRNFFAMPDFVESPYIRTRFGINKGVVIQWFFRTEHKPFTNQPIWIYTPFNYSKDKKYPVLYVYDGASTLYTRPLLNVVNNLIQDKKIEPVILVFVGFEDRWTEYVSESVEWAKLMKDELVPFIEKNFSVADTPEKRGIMGASASGHGAIVTAMQYPDVFGNVASQGGGAGGYPGLNPIANAALDTYLIKRKKSPLRKIYTEVGAFDLEFPKDKIVFADGVYQFNQRMSENGIDYIFNCVNGGHNAAIWNQSLDDILILFFGIK
jgi:enterochelin esterase-like enzyme